jgi:hypothetical protein
MQKFFKNTVPALLLIMLMNGVSIKAQLAGIYNVPSVTFPSINSIVTTLNTSGISAPVTINVAAGFVENAPAGGIHMTASGSSANPIIFQKSGVGANPRINAYTTGTATANSATQDGIWRLVGSDYVTIDGIDLFDPNVSNNATMEYGYALYKNSNLSGANYNTIQNCVITLNRINNTTGNMPSADGSKGILVSFAYYNSSTAYANPFISAMFVGNLFNRFYSNIIQNCNIGIALIGASNPMYADMGNDIGGSSAATSNTIINFGGATPSGNSSMAIKTSGQDNLNASFNIINSNNGSGINHPNALYGIFLGSGGSATISNNTITLHGGGTNQGLYPIENNSGSWSNIININNNIITNCTYPSITSAFYFCISNYAPCGVLNINGNDFIGNSSNNNSSGTSLIRNTAAVTSSININNNYCSFTYTGSGHPGGFTGITAQAISTTCSVSICSNTFANVVYNNTGTGAVNFIDVSGNISSLRVDNNIWNNLSLNNSGFHRLIYDASIKQNVLSVSNNSVINNYVRTPALGSGIWCCLIQGSSPGTCVQTMSNNNFSNIQSLGSTSNNFIGIYNSDGTASPFPRKTISNNIVSNIIFGGTGSCTGLSVDRLGDGGTSIGTKIFDNEISNITSTNVISGIEISSSGSPTIYADIYSNKIMNLTSTNSMLYGVFLSSGGAGINFFRNKISNINSNVDAGPVSGLYISNSNVTNIYNNVIGNITCPAGAWDDRAIGIRINNGNTINLIHNSVFLNASSTSGTFGSSALSVVTTVTLNLRNNILINLSTPNGANGRTVAYRRSSNTLTTYSSTSNNNIFYAGIPGANRLIAYDGTTSWSTLASWKTSVTPRDAGSFTESTPFISTSGATANFLNIDPMQMTNAESNASPVGTITNDYIASPRNLSTPDIGAWEDNFLLNTLPIELAGFRAVCENLNGISIYWNIFTETNAVSYVIEKSPNGTDWEEIANVQYSTKNSRKGEYSFNDKIPFPKMSYYRLKQKYSDDSFQNSEVILVENCYVSGNEIHILPNPAKEKLFIGGINGDTRIEIFNSTGAKVSDHFLLHEGSLNITDLPAGTYLVKIIGNATVATKKVIITD